MIINWGWDFLFLAQPYLWRGDNTHNLVVIAADDDLQHYFTEVVTNTYNGRLDDYHDAILDAIDEDFVRYFAIAHESPPCDSSDLDFELTKRLGKAASSRGQHLISHLYVAHDTWCSTGPMFRLSQYMGAGTEYPLIRSERPPQYSRARRSKKLAEIVASETVENGVGEATEVNDWPDWTRPSTDI